MIAQLDKRYISLRPYKIYSRMLSYVFFEGRPLTTKGQWINRLVFALFSLEKRLPVLRRVVKPAFILGTGRSGTTVLGMVLSMHREVGFLNEPKALWHAIYPNEDIIGSYSRGTARYRLGGEEVTLEVNRSAHRLFGSYLAASFSRRVVDKYPELIFRVPFVKEIFPDAKFLFLVRNGWDTCHSIQFWSERLGQIADGETHDWWGVNRRKWNLLIDQIIPEHPDLAIHAEAMRRWSNYTDMAALEWIVTMREGLSLLKHYPDDVQRVSYEELCLESREEMLKISKFLELPDDELFIRYGEQTLKSVDSKPPVKLDIAIETAFIDTMSTLGYEI